MNKKVKVFFISSGISYFKLVNAEIDGSNVKVLLDKEIDFNKIDLIILSEQSSEGRQISILSVKSINNLEITFEKVENITGSFYENHFVNYHDSFDIVPFDKMDENIYREYERRTNVKSYSSRLYEAYSREDDDNREILSFLFDINSKLDEVLYLLKPVEELTGALNVKSIFLGGEGIFFITDKEIDKDMVYIRGFLRDNAGFLNFSSVSKLFFFKKLNKYVIYRAVFDNLAEDTKDSIIKYVFRRERERLKED